MNINVNPGDATTVETESIPNNYKSHISNLITYVIMFSVIKSLVVLL